MVKIQSIVKGLNCSNHGDTVSKATEMGYIWLISFIIASLLTISYYLLNSASMPTFSVSLSLQLHVGHY